jgi:hypothetical protein
MERLLCGDAYGLSYSPRATYAIALLLGTPDQVSPDGHWRTEYRVGAAANTFAHSKDGKR